MRRTGSCFQRAKCRSLHRSTKAAAISIWTTCSNRTAEHKLLRAISTGSIEQDTVTAQTSSEVRNGAVPC